MPWVTEEQIERARGIDLLSYLQAYEPYELKPDGHGRYTTDTHGSLVISNGKWIWNQGKCGGVSALDFLMKVRGVSLVDAVETLTGERAAVARSYQEEAKKQPQAKKYTFYPPRPVRYSNKVVSYLQRRGINPVVANQCIQLGTLYESRYFNPQSVHHNAAVCVFVGKDETGAIRFAAMRGINSDMKQDKAGSDKRYNFHIPPKNPQSRHLAVFEAPIDALSHATMQIRDGWIWDGHRLSLGGTSDIALIAFLERNPQIYNSMSPDALSELNYLAAKIDAMQPDELEIFSAALEADRHCGRYSELINLTENLGCLYLQPAFTPEQYGEFLLTMDQDLISGTIEKIKKSNDPNLHDLVSYLEKLESHVDPESYARARAEEESGVFTEHGYLTENDDFKEVYRGPDDIPAEYRVSGYHEQQRTELLSRTIPAPIRKVENTDLTALLAKMHVLGGDYAADIRYNLNMLEMRRSSEYLLLMNGRHAFLSEAEHAYRRGTDAFDAIMKADEENIDTRIFALHITDAHREHVVGNMVEVNVREVQRDILSHSISPERIDATPKFGPDVSYTPEEWDKLEAIDHHMLQSWTRRYDLADSQAVIRHLEESRDNHAQSGSVISSGELLSILNTICMEVAENPQQNMLLLPISAAKNMLTHGDAAVFRLMPEGAKELSPLDAMPGRGGLWYQSYREFAIKADDLSGLDKWAKRETETIISKMQPERDTPDKPKSHGPEL